METKERSIIEKLAAFTVSLDCDRLPEEVVEKVKLCIADALECCLDGNRGDARSEAAWKYVSARTGTSAAFARGKNINSPDAAFYNAVTGAVSSRNDISKSGSCHAGSVVVPVVLALAQERSCTGKQILEAVLAGYETMIRLGIAIRLSDMPKAFRSTAVLGPFGAAYAAAKILGLDEEQTANAASFSCHSASGFNNWVTEGTGEDVLQNAWGAKNGMEAALLAATGLRAAKYTLEDADGLLSAFSAMAYKDKITEDLGEKWHILDVDFKPMGSCLKLMAPCQIAKKLIGQIPDVKEISRIRIGVAEKTLFHAGTSETNVTSQVQAIMSIPFGIANVLAKGDYRGIRWYPPYTQEVMDYMKICTVEEQPALTALFPGKRGAELIVTCKDGKEFCMLQEDVEGLDAKDVKQLFCATMEEFYGNEAANTLWNKVGHLEKQEHLDELYQILQQSNREIGEEL